MYALTDVNWSFLDSFVGINSACVAFYTRIPSISECFVPKYKVCKRECSPWYMKQLIQLIHHKSQYQRMFKTYRREGHRLEFVHLRALIKSLACQAYRSYLLSLESQEPK